MLTIHSSAGIFTEFSAGTCKVCNSFEQYINEWTDPQPDYLKTGYLWEILDRKKDLNDWWTFGFIAKDVTNSPGLYLQLQNKPLFLLM